VIGTSALQLQVTMPINGRYLLLLNDSQLSVDAELAIAIVQTSATGFTPQLAYDAETDQVTLGTPAVPTATPFFFDPFVTPTPSLLGGNTSIPGGGQGPVVCPSVTFTCSQLFTCQEAYACLAAGAVALDPDGDGVPCPNLCAP
jgi:hypothetical protein